MSGVGTSVEDLGRRLSESTTLVFIAAALALTVPHLLARPHVLALPVMGRLLTLNRQLDDSSPP